MPMRAVEQKKDTFFSLNIRKTDHTVKMKLPIAIAVLFLVLAANTEAQEEQVEPTLEERFKDFGVQMSVFADNLKDKTKATIENIQQSDFAIKTSSWFKEQFEKMKQKVDDTFNPQ